MIRHLKILEYALGTLARRKGKNTSIGVVFAFVVAALTSILFLTDSLKHEANLLLRGAPDLIVQGVSAGRHELIPVGHAEPIREIPGVASVQPRHWGYYYDPLTDSNYTVLGANAELFEPHTIQGRMPTAPGECAVGAGVAAVRGLEQGDDLVLVDSDNLGVIYEVVGVFAAESALLTNDLIVLLPEDVVTFFGLSDGRATDLMVRVRNPNEVSTVARKVKQLLPETRPITKTEILRTYDTVFNWRSGMLLAAFSGALVAFCILAWDKATGISAEEKQEIGVLKAVGWDTSDVLELKFWEGLALALTSVLVGLIVAYVHVFLLGAPVLAAVLKGWSVLFPDFTLVPQVGLRQLATLGFLTVAPYVASTVIPAWRAAITDPETVMRA